MGFPGGWAVKNLPVNAGDLGLIPGSGRSPGEENDNPLWFAWRIPRQEAWWVTVHGAEKRHDWVTNTFTSLWNPGKVKKAEQSLFPTNRNRGHGKDLYLQGPARFHKDWQIFFFFVSLTDKWNWTFFFHLQSWLITKQLDNDLNAVVKIVDSLEQWLTILLSLCDICGSSYFLLYPCVTHWQLQPPSFLFSTLKSLFAAPL